MTDWETVGTRIQARRKELGLTQAELGQRVGSTANHVAQVEGGLPVSEKKLAVYATALGVSIPFLRYGLVTELDRAAIEAAAYAAGRADAFSAMRGFLGRDEGPMRHAPRYDEQGAEVFDRSNTRPVSPERIDQARVAVAAEESPTPAPRRRKRNE